MFDIRVVDHRIRFILVKFSKVHGALSFPFIPKLFCILTAILMPFVAVCNR